MIDRSGTITTGGVAQQLAPDGTRRGFSIQNLSTADLYFNLGATAVQGQPSFRIPANTLYESPVGCDRVSGVISIIGATTGQAFTAKEW